MDYTLALVLSLLQLISMSTAAPVPVEVVKYKVKWMAEQLLVRLDSGFQAPARYPGDPGADNLDGLSSIVMVLQGYNSLISDDLEGVSQVKSDISSLTGYLVEWKPGNCIEQRPKPLVPGPLQALQSKKGHIETVSIEALMRVKEFLNLLLKNLDHLETC